MTPRRAALLAAALACLLTGGCTLSFALPKLSGTSSEVKRLERTLSVNADNPHGQFLLGKRLLEEHHPQAAARAFERALALEPQFEEAALGLGLANLQRKRWRPAEKSYRRALAIAPQSAAAYEGMAAARLGRGDLKGAEGAANEALGLNPGSIHAHRILGEVAYARADYEEALRHWELALSDGSLSSELLPLVKDLRQFVAKYR